VVAVVPVVPVPVVVIVAVDAPTPFAPLIVPLVVPLGMAAELMDPRRPTDPAPSDEAEEPPHPAPPSDTVVAAPMLVAPMADLSESMAYLACWWMPSGSSTGLNCTLEFVVEVVLVVAADWWWWLIAVGIADAMSDDDADGATGATGATIAGLTGIDTPLVDLDTELCVCVALSPVALVAAGAATLTFACTPGARASRISRISRVSRSLDNTAENTGALARTVTLPPPPARCWAGGGGGISCRCCCCCCSFWRSV